MNTLKHFTRWIIIPICLVALHSSCAGLGRKTKSDRNGTPAKHVDTPASKELSHEQTLDQWKETFRLQVEQRGEDIRICGDKFPEVYKSRPKKSSENSIRIEFTVTADGKTQKLRSIQNTTGSKGIENCLMTAFKKAKFDPLPKGESKAVVTYPFTFSTSPQTIR